MRIAIVAAVLAIATGAGAAAADTRDGEGWQLEVVAPPAGPAGAARTATVTLRARDGWKLNVEYPFKLELTAGPGATVARPTLRRADARRYDDRGAAIDVAITVTKAGTATVDGVVRFATCDDAVCAPHKERFTITATATAAAR